jgi:hypothetical protein
MASIVGLEGANFVFRNGGFPNISGDHMTALKQYLDSKYGVSELMWSGVFLIITGRREVPPSDPSIKGYGGFAPSKIS